MSLPAAAVAALVALLAGAAGWRAAPWLRTLARLSAHDQRRPWTLRPAVVACTCAGLAALSVLTAHAQELPPATWSGLAVGWVAAGAAALVDAAAHRLPDVLVLRVGGVGVALAVVGALVAGRPALVLGALAGAVVGYLVLGLVAFAYPPGMGYGDVKLAALLGALLGLASGFGPAPWWGGAIVAVAMLLLAFVVGGVGSLVLLAARRVTARTAVPFGPVLVLAAAVVAAGFA